MAKQKKKRPLLTKEDRARLAVMAAKAEQNGQTINAAYCRGVRDTLRWLIAEDEDMARLMEEITR